ncbi:ArsR/SmtB family transcription factor [Singulisphaera rosea]
MIRRRQLSSVPSDFGRVTTRPGPPHTVGQHPCTFRGTMREPSGPQESEKLPVEAILQAAAVFQIISSPTRLSILWLLGSGERGVTDLWSNLDVDPSALSHALAKLRLPGLVERQSVGKAAVYRLTPRGKRLLRTIKVFLADDTG